MLSQYIQHYVILVVTLRSFLVMLLYFLIKNVFNMAVDFRLN